MEGVVKQASVDKYTTYLKAVLIKISKDSGFCFADYCRENHLPSGFLSALLSLKYIHSFHEGISTRYSILMPSFGVSELHGRKIAEWIHNYNGKHNNRECACKEKVPTVCQLTDEELLKELIRRGYIGELTKTNTIKL